MQLISGSLDSILNSFNSKIKKGYFPYSFVNKDNINYIGDKPTKIFYNSIPDSLYQAIPKRIETYKKKH
jgi:hypothetical protein